MTYLSLREVRSGAVREFEAAEVRLGRDSECEWPIAGEGSEVVSGQHARFFFRDGRWWVEDVGSRNGTSLNDRQLPRGQAEPVAAGGVVALGERGPRFRVEATEKRRIAATVIEPSRAARPSAPTMPMQALEDGTLSIPGLSAPARVGAELGAPPAQPSPPPAPPPPPAVKVVVRDTRSGDRFEAKGGRVRIGRGDECELRPVAPGDTSVSRVHAEIVLLPDGKVVVRDARSRNGTLVNDRLLVGDHPLKQGERVKLGEGGPDLLVEELVLPGAKAEPAKAAAGAAPEDQAVEGGRGRRSFAGKGKTVFFREMMEETTRKSASRLRVVVWSFVGLLILAVGGIYWFTQQRVRQTTVALEEQRQAMLRQQAQADSIRRAAAGDYERLRQELENARSTAAPSVVLDSLRQAMAAASRRTEALEGALKRAESQMAAQLAAGDSARRAAQAELARVRSELSRASTGAGQASAAVLDSLRNAFREAQQRAEAVEAQVRAVKGVNLPAIAEANGNAIGLVWTYNPDEEGSGFVLTPSGYFVTNRHVVANEQGRRADSVTIILADQRIETARRADVVAVAAPDGPDLALLKIRSYKGPHARRIDWAQAHARQGESAAVIGFPSGSKYAFKQSLTPRTTMSAGILSKVTPELVQWEGLSMPGSSGSPVFNGDGEVVAVHRASNEGIKFGVPISLLIPLLPPDAKAELGLR